MTVLVKFGSALVSASVGVDHRFLRAKCGELAGLLAAGTQVLVVSSGAVAAGMEAEGISQRPQDVLELQLLSGIGQVRLMRCYRDYLKLHGVQTAQVLLTHYNFDSPPEQRAVTAVLRAYLSRGIVPVINENDLVNKEELDTAGRFTDNDILAALVAERLGVDLALLLTTVPGLLDSAGQLLPTVEQVTPEIRALANDSVAEARSGQPGPGPSGVGGMASKLEAAGQMTAAGIDVVVGDGRRALQDLVSNAAPRTLFVAERHRHQRSAS